MKINDVLFEFAPSGDSGGSGDYFQALASAWYNGTFDSGSLQKGIKSQQDVEQLLQRGIIGPDGVTRKYGIDYNSTFDGVVISSDDYYEHADHDETDSRTGKPFGPYDYMEFGDEELDEGLTEVDRRGFLRGLGAAAVAGAAGGAKGQTIGGGEDEAKDAAVRAANVFFNLAKASNRETAQWVHNTLYNRIMQYHNFGGQQIPTVADVATKAAQQAVIADFQSIYNQVERDKNDTSFLGTYMKNRLGNRFGVDAGGRDAQQKMSGSLDRFNLQPQAEKFVKEYTRALQEALSYFKQQNQPAPPQTQTVDPDLEQKRRENMQRMQQAAGATKESVNQGVAEGDRKPEPPEADYGADYQDMVSRVKKLAGLGPLRTVYDPQKRVYKNMPTATQPKKEQR